MLKYLVLTAVILLGGCRNSVEEGKSNNETSTEDKANVKTEVVESERSKPKLEAEKTEVAESEENSPVTLSPQPVPGEFRYSWLEQSSATDAIVNRIAPPSGFVRKPVAPGSFADWLRHLPLKPEGSPVYLFNGRLKGNQDAHFAVINIDAGKRDLQQCADAVMRLKAEYHFGKKEFDKIHFNYTSGDRVSFSDWARGRKPIIRGNKVLFSDAGDQKDYSYPNFRKYLIQIFSYAGTASLSKELKKVRPADIAIGDVFIRGGFPGHAVIVVDMAENEQGEKRFMLAQSYMPAQEIHILRNPGASPDSPWYKPDFGNTLETPEWSFSSDELKRFSR